MSLNRQQFIQLNTLYDVIPKHSKILIALSGGVDSVVLLDLLYKTRQYFQIELGICHVNHHLREDVHEDVQFVKKLAKKYHLNHMHIEDISPSEWENLSKVSTEEYARKRRYQILDQVREKYRYDCIVTAHHKDDVAETVLMRILEGSGMTGLAGVRLKWKHIRRPLFFFSKKEILAYAEKSALEFRQDYTNEDTRYKRNRIRHQLIPALKDEFNPSIEDALLKLALHAQEMEQWLDEELLKIDIKSSQWIVQIDKKQYYSVPAFVKKIVLEKALNRISREPVILGHNTIVSINHRLESDQNSPLSLKPGLFLWNNAQRIWIYKKLAINAVEISGESKAFEFPSGMKIECKIHSDRNSALELIDVLKKDSQRKPFKQMVVCIGNSDLPLRAEQVSENDWFIPMGSKYRVTILDYLRDHKIPLPHRIHWPVIKNNQGRVIAVPGFLPAAENSVSSESVRFLEITIFNQSDFFV